MKVGPGDVTRLVDGLGGWVVEAICVAGVIGCVSAHQNRNGLVRDELLAFDLARLGKVAGAAEFDHVSREFGIVVVKKKVWWCWLAAGTGNVGDVRLCFCKFCPHFRSGRWCEMGGNESSGSSFTVVGESTFYLPIALRSVASGIFQRDIVFAADGGHRVVFTSVVAS